MNILVLYGFKDLSLARNTSINHLYSFKTYAPEHNYVYHCAYRPVTKHLKQIDFCGIILDTSFVSQRTVRPRALLDELRSNYTWLKDSTAVKLALPQDEYDECDVLDEWLEEMGVDVIGSVVGHRQALYPRMLQQAEFIDLLTGYVDDMELSRIENFVKPMAYREIDIGYRGRVLPYHIGRLGQQKTEIYRQFKKATKGRGLNIDLAVLEDDALFGDDWRRFNCNSRFTLGSQSGSSLRDPRGKIRDALEVLLSEQPETTFEEAEKMLFPDEDGRYVFSAISPRIFEAAAARTCQILIEGHYLEGFEPNVHYIPLKPDYSNIGEVVERVRDLEEAEQIADRCYRLLIDDHRYRYKHFVGLILTKINKLCEVREQTHMPAPDFRRLLKLHKRTLNRSGGLGGLSEKFKGKVIKFANSNAFLLRVFNALLRVRRSLRQVK